MGLYILDTDHVSMWLENHPTVKLNVTQHVTQSETDLAITIVTVQELFNGWIGRLNDPAQVNQQVKLYGKLSKVVAFLQEANVLDFDETADQVFRHMLTNHPPLRKTRLQKDMRIASIAITHNAVVITRNHRDFSQVPNLQILDWSTEEL
jgi:tRNA(fMet)-specific endonuclease VapC